MSIEVLRYFCQSFLDLYKKCSLNTHMYRTEYRLRLFLNRVVSALLSLSLCLSLSHVYGVSLRSPLNLRFFPSTRFPYLLPHAIFYMVSEREG